MTRVTLCESLRAASGDARDARGCYDRRVITIELFGIPRLRAGREVVAVEAASLGQAFRELGAACPSLEPSVVERGQLKAHYRAAINGTIITADPAAPLVDGDVVILLSADAGG